MRIPLPIGVMVLCLCACRPTASWNEDVQLSTGQVIQVRRTIEWVRSNPVGDADIWGVRVTRLTFPLASGQVISWSAVSEKAMVLDYDKAAAEYFIVTAPTRCSVWRKSGKPKPPYFEYRLRGKRWQRVRLTPNLIDRTANLLLQFSIPIPRTTRCWSRSASSTKRCRSLALCLSECSKCARTRKIFNCR